MALDAGLCRCVDDAFYLRSSSGRSLHLPEVRRRGVVGALPSGVGPYRDLVPEEGGLRAVGEAGPLHRAEPCVGSPVGASAELHAMGDKAEPRVRVPQPSNIVPSGSRCPPEVLLFHEWRTRELVGFNFYFWT